MSATIAHHAISNGLTICQAAHRMSVGLGHRSVIGTTQSIAYDFEAWIEAEATNEFALILRLRDVTSHVVLEPKRCGLFKGEYTGPTLRENFGLKRPKNLHLLRKVARAAAQ